MDTIKHYLQAPDWSSVRPVYKKLSDEFDVLLRAYEVSLSDERKVMLDHLILGIDEVDRCLDPIAKRTDREAVMSELVRYLSDSQDSLHHKMISPTLARRMSLLKAIVWDIGAQDQFIEGVKNVFHHTEAKRHTSDASALINHIVQEGLATAELPLSIMQIDSSHGFSILFSRLCILMGLADLIVDVKSDFELNYIRVRPSIRLYLTLIYKTTAGGIKLIWAFPKKWSFLMYCIRMTWSLLRS